jgi:ABC-type nitrate/sulfonate/bicarbonate transport system substrate-binding protein
MHRDKSVISLPITTLACFLWCYALAAADSIVPHGTTATLNSIKMAVANFGINSMPYAVAREKGYFLEEGLQLDFIVTSSAAAMAATHSGAVEFTGFAGSAIGAAMQGLPVKVVLALSKKPKYWIFSKPEIRSLAELSGSTLAVGLRGGGPHIYALIILDKFGLTAKIQVLPLSGFTARAVAQLLINGQIQAGYASDSTYYELKDRGFRELVNYGDHIEEPSSAVAVSQEIIHRKPEIIQAFVNASYRGMLFFRQHRSESIAIMVKHMKLPPGTATRLYDLAIPAFGGDGIIGYAPLRKLLESRKEVLGLDAEIPSYGALVDSRFAARIPRALTARSDLLSSSHGNAKD